MHSNPNSQTENNSENNLPDFEKNKQKAGLKKILILMVLAVAIVLIGFAFGMDLSAQAKLLRFLT